MDTGVTEAVSLEAKDRSAADNLVMVSAATEASSLANPPKVAGGVSQTLADSTRCPSPQGARQASACEYFCAGLPGGTSRQLALFPALEESSVQLAVATV